MEQTTQITLKNFNKDVSISSKVMKELFIDLTGAELQVMFHLLCFLNKLNTVIRFISSSLRLGVESCSFQRKEVSPIQAGL